MWWVIADAHLVSFDVSGVGVQAPSLEPALRAMNVNPACVWIPARHLSSHTGDVAAMKEAFCIQRTISLSVTRWWAASQRWIRQSVLKLPGDPGRRIVVPLNGTVTLAYSGVHWQLEVTTGYGSDRAILFSSHVPADFLPSLDLRLETGFEDPVGDEPDLRVTSETRL